MTLKHVVEALLFASQKPLTPKEVVSALRAAVDYFPDEPSPTLAKTKAAEVEATLEELRAEYESLGRAFRLAESVAGWQLVSDPECSPWVRMLFPEGRPARLSGPALETLAIIAYRQPITRADIEAVRGVAVDGVMQTLLDRGLVKIAGRAEIPGRPLLYQTTQSFMEHFGLKDLDELPNSSELRRIELPTAKIEEEPAKGGGKGGAKGTAEKPEQMELANGGKAEAAAEVTESMSIESIPSTEDTAVPSEPEPPQDTLEDEGASEAPEPATDESEPETSEEIPQEPAEPKTQDAEES